MRHAFAVFALTLIINLRPVWAMSLDLGPAVSESPPAQSSPTAGTAAEMIPPPNTTPKPSSSSVGLLGQDHAYSVTFRDNGEAVVSLRVTFSNIDRGPLDKLLFQIPKGSPRDVVAFQVRREPFCIRYAPQPYPLKPDPSGAPPPDQCLEYQRPDYFDHWWGQSTYFPAETTVRDSTITVVLPNALSPNESGSVILYYRAVGLTSRTWTGSWAYTFETAKVSDRIRQVQVGISTDNDQLLKGARTQVDYYTSTEGVAASRLSMDSSGAPSEQLDRAVQQIGSGKLVKTATDLQPMESYSVRGEYAENIMQLYGLEAVSTLLILMAVFTVVFAAYRFIMRRFGLSSKIRSFKLLKNTAVALLAGLGSAIAIGVFSIAVTTAVVFINNNVVHYQTQILAMLGVFIVVTGVYLFLFLVPAIAVGIRRGLWVGVGTAAVTLTILTLVAGLFILAALLSNSSRYDYAVLHGKESPQRSR